MNNGKEMISSAILSSSKTNCCAFDYDLLNDNIDTLIAYGTKSFNLCMLDKFSCYAVERIIDITNDIPNVNINLVLCKKDITDSFTAVKKNEPLPNAPTKFYQSLYLMKIMPDYFDNEAIVKYYSTDDGKNMNSLSPFKHIAVVLLDTHEDVINFCNINTNLTVSENGRLKIFTVPLFNYQTLIFEKNNL